LSPDYITTKGEGMRRIKLIGLACSAVFAPAAIAATASATLPNILPTTAGITFISANGTGVFSNPFLEITSSDSAGTFESTGTEGNAGSFKLTFEGTKTALLGTCTGVGQASGHILVSGTYKVVSADLPLPVREIVAILFLLSPQVEFKCGTTGIAVNSCVAGELTRTSELANFLAATFTRLPTDDEIITYLNARDAPEACQLLGKAGAGVTELWALETTQDLSKFAEGGKAIEVLLML
jgi:hypothetical protein